MQPHQQLMARRLAQAVAHHLRVQHVHQALRAPQQLGPWAPQPAQPGAPQPAQPGQPMPQQAAPLALSKAPPPVNPTAIASVQNMPRNALAERSRGGRAGRPAQ